MADLLNNLMLSKHSVLPQLSDSDLILLNTTNSHQQEHNDLIDLDFDLACLDALDHTNEFNHTNQFNQQSTSQHQTQQRTHSIDNQTYCEVFDPKSFAQNQINFNCFEQYNEPNDCFLASNESIENSPSYTSTYQQAYATQYNDALNFNEFTIEELNTELNELNSDDLFNELINGEQLVQSPVEYTNQSYGDSTSNGYLNQIINSPVDSLTNQTTLNSPTSTIATTTDYYCNTNSPSIDYSLANNSPNHYSIQSVSSSIDYSIQSVNSTYCGAHSYTNSPSSTSYTDSPESYEAYSDYLSYSNSLDHSSTQFSNQFDQSSTQFSSQFEQNQTALQSNPISSNETNKQQAATKAKRKRSRKAPSEEEIRRKLELKAERRRKRLERKKVQNKEAARRYRDKKKQEEDQINLRLVNVKGQYENLRKQLKDTLDEKKVLVKLLKDFADQSSNFILPKWMKNF